MRLFIVLALICTTSFATTVDEKEQIFSLIAKLPKVSKAIIKRGKIEIPVDLSQKSQIKDYDVLILDEGVYSTLGDFSAKYVRVIGKGQRKTFISSLAKNSSPILVNSTEFWDLSIADAQFKISDVNGLWAVNVEFAGSILVRPASQDKSPAFAIRSVFSDLANSDLRTEDKNLYTVLKIEEATAANLLAYEDKLDRTDDINLKERSAYKGLIARGANYLYQMKNLKPQYDQAKYNQLAKQAKAAKSKGHLYVSMLFWAEADRLSGHSRFDEVLKEISPLTQNVSQDCGCTVEGQGLASNIKTEIEAKLFAKLPITSLPGRCKIQTLHVNTPFGAKKETLISAARLQAQLDQAASFRARESAFQESMLAHSGGLKSPPAEEDFEVGAPALVTSSMYTLVADLDMPGVRKSYSSDVVVGKNDDGNYIAQNIIDPIAKVFADKFTAKIKAATAKIKSTDLLAKVDGYIIQALYGADLEKQHSYEDLHEQQFGRKLSTTGAMSSVFAY